VCVAMLGWCLVEAALRVASRRDGRQGLGVHALVREFGTVSAACTRDLLAGGVRVLYIGIRRPGSTPWPSKQVRIFNLD
jgi:hypothetical protein